MVPLIAVESHRGPRPVAPVRAVPLRDALPTRDGRLVKSELIIVTARETNVIVSQLRKHLTLALGTQDAFDHHVEPIV